MIYYKDAESNTYKLESPEQENSLPAGCIRIDAAQADAIRLSRTPTQPPIPQPTYRQLRAAAYPPPADYLDAWVKNDTVALEAYRSACLAVKTKYPKV